MRGWADGAELALGPPQQQAVLALLLTGGGRPVPLSHLVDALWPVDPPTSAANVVHRYVGALRRLIEPDLPRRATGRWLLPVAGGYQPVVDADSLDLLRFRELVRRAGGREPREALALLVEALELWQGPVAAGITGEVRSGPQFVAVEHERVVAARRAAALAADLGEAQVVLPALRSAAREHPLDEALHADLMLALAASGAQAEAIEVYEALRARLAEELGLDPGEVLRAAHRSVLGPAPLSVRPAQLPRPLDAFVGRREQSEAVERAIADGERLIAVTGMAGVGKTTFAVRLAHRVADRFPDGLLYANLRGYHPGEPAVKPAVQLREFLHALGVRPGDVPEGEQGRSALLRSLLDGRRVLVLLDNARDAEQVRPLLPGAGCLAVVTSRDDLAGLVATHNARPVRLDVLDPASARQLLARRLGARRVEAEEAAVDTIIAACARLPLALAVVAARAATRPTFALAALAEDLADAREGLDALSAGDVTLDVRAVFSWSYDALSTDAARLFRLLPLAPGADIGVAAAAALLGASPARARRLLTELTGVHLLDEHTPGRYALHDLLRVYATELTHTHDTPGERDAAITGVLGHYLHTAVAAAMAMSPDRVPIPLDPPPPTARPTAFADADRAVGWLAAERVVLLAAQALAFERGEDGIAWRLGWALAHHLDRAGHWHDLVVASEVAIEAARRAGDRLGEGHGLVGLARAEADLGRVEVACEHGELALTVLDGVAEQRLLADVHRFTSWLYESTGDYDHALAHARKTLAAQRSGSDVVRTARALNAVGWCLSLLGRYDEALEHCQEGLALMTGTGDEYGLADLRDSIGHALFHLGRVEEAVHSYELALQAYLRLGVRYAAADTGERLGDAEAAAGRPERAAERWRAALVTFEELELPRVEGLRAKLAHLR
ncbi:AfsR/SARP family transcriptional regulator [Saccharothrix coeruleofusca]|uniref:SARP family transcriptional regulator n=1 Tax=Saccharothrix coeruleofusca TaxID=33919 RepID=A0A918ALR7_9PSEU|nr:BTAD domain-containing putative transcriptional regulator [Saccharothrix coeruleofusca]MBP2336097.1 DNA-binding SARP family transcriptional activator [Saccharothrix coeruleofusca]GGP55436.1 SARP family transcriptional regulator [Saccharothrix coeruleofusca]